MHNNSFNQSLSGPNAPSTPFAYMWPKTEHLSQPSFDVWHSQPSTPVESVSASQITWQSVWNPYNNSQLPPQHPNNQLLPSYQTYYSNGQSFENPSNCNQQPVYQGWLHKNESSEHMHSYQSRQTYGNNSFIGNYTSTESSNDYIEEEKTQRQKDQEWLNDLITLHYKNFKIMPCPKSEQNITEMQKIITECLTLCDTLRTAHGILLHALHIDESVWKKISHEANAIKENLRFSMSKLTSTSLNRLKQYIKKRHNKRERQRKQRRAKHEENLLNEQCTKNEHMRIDAWQESIRQAHLAAEMERRMKKEADSILSEVRKKRAEATKMLELVKAICKLRTLKKHSAKNRGLYTSLDCDDKFLKITANMENMLNTRLTEYGEEERTLQVMLDEEHQVTRESVVKQRQQEQKEKLDAVRQEKIFSLFGPKEIVCELDPRFSYWKYQTQADRDLDTLIHVRQSWDMWLVSPEMVSGSRIPLAWVVPVKPSSEAWAAYLDKDYSSF